MAWRKPGVLFIPGSVWFRIYFFFANSVCIYRFGIFRPQPERIFGCNLFSENTLRRMLKPDCLKKTTHLSTWLWDLALKQGIWWSLQALLVNTGIACSWIYIKTFQKYKFSNATCPITSGFQVFTAFQFGILTSCPCRNNNQRENFGVFLTFTIFCIAHLHPEFPLAANEAVKQLTATSLKIKSHLGSRRRTGRLGEASIVLPPFTLLF